MKRIFIAIKVIPGENLTRMHSAFRSQLAGERITWVDPSNIHITLAFLGDTPEEKLNEISEVLKDQCSNTGSFAFEIAGAGVFRNLKDPRVIWAGIRSPEKLVDLGNKIQSALRNKGFSLDDKPFRPHITLGRIKHLNDLSKIEKNEIIAAMLWKPDRILPSLYELRNQGLISKISEIDNVRQFTISYTLEQIVDRLVSQGQ